jgi:hypothetical protein
MIIPPARRQVVCCHGPPRVIEPSPSQFRIDKGLLPTRQLDEMSGLNQAFANG